MNIAFYVSGNAGRLRKILEQNKPELISSTKLIFSDDNRNIDLGDVLQPVGVAYHCMNYEDIAKTAEKSRSLIMSDELLRLLLEHRIDYCFSFGDHLLVGKLLEVYENKIINFHPSVLPMFPGMRSIDQAVEANSNLLGNTAHFIDQGMDTGPIIMQNILSCRVFSDKEYDKVLDQQLPMLYQIFKWLEDGRVTVNNREVTIEGATYEKPAFFPLIEDN